MKKIASMHFTCIKVFSIIFFMQFVFTQQTNAQQNIDSLEFGIDNIGAFGQAVNKIPVTPAPVVNAFPFNVNISSVSNGIHTLYVRTHSTTTSPPMQGYWSETNYTYFYKQNNVTATVSTVQKVEYFIDTDPGIGSAINIPITPATQVSGISFNPNIGALSNGFHVLFIRSLDANGKWSITNYQYFYKQNNVGATVSTVSKMEYFIDTDPGAGNAQPITISPATNISGLSFNADISSVAAGFHVIFIRSLDANGKWSITNYAYFFKAGPQTATAVNIIKIEYYIDTDPGYFNAQDIPVTAAPDIANKSFAANITGLSVGLHYLNVRSLDSRNKWSLNAFDTFRIASTLPLRLLNFSAAAANTFVNVTWQTTFEQNLKTFEIEHSADGITFTKIGNVIPVNNPSGSAYVFKHFYPVPGANFYRLKIIELDGAYSYSNIKLVDLKSSQPPVTIYPDPADKYFMVKTDLQNFSLDIIAADGKLIRTLQHINTNLTVDVSGLPSGLYNIRINSKSKITNTFLIVKH
ncbi:MAG: T9SS type A sorting domain-containing protein [Chitinophagaceae bacterium]|nr:T9SS type A sorting domain-containing protein [Chitinophagaceae bacterium]